jgi:hypothetical protein
MSRFLNARTAFFVLVGLTVVVALARFFEQNPILGTTATMVVLGTAFAGGGMYLEDAYEGDPQRQQVATKVRAIGFILIGLGTLFGALMLLL